MKGPESYPVSILEGTLGKPYAVPLQKLSLMPSPTAPHVKLHSGRYMKGAFAFFAALVLVGFLGLMLYVAYLMLDMFTLHQIQRHWRALLRAMYAATKGPIFVLCLVPFVAAPLFAAILYPSLWAWNRRARRLNYEATLPPPVFVAALGVWPPPPTVSIPADVLPKK